MLKMSVENRKHPRVFMEITVLRAYPRTFSPRPACGERGRG
jgi:hypothetical protein